MALTREEILSAKDHEIEEVDVPEWGGTVFVRSIGATAKERIGQKIVGPDGKERNMIGFRAAIAAEAIVDAQGQRIFSAADLESLGEKCEAVLDRIVAVAQKLSKMEPGQAEAEVGNSSGGQSAVSTSA